MTPPPSTPSITNGRKVRFDELPMEERVRRVGQMVGNVLSSRFDWLKSLTPDRRRDIDDECGYPKDGITLEMYRRLYERDPIAARVVEVLPDECWQVSPTVYEKEDAEVRTDFEQAWASLGRGIKGWKSWHREEEGSVIWDYLRRADKLSGIGTYGIILLGIDDGLTYDQPVAGLPPDWDGSPFGSRKRGPAPSTSMPSDGQMRTPKVRVYDNSGVEASNPLWNALYPPSDATSKKSSDGGKNGEPDSSLGIKKVGTSPGKKVPTETLPPPPDTKRKLVFLRVFPQHLVRIEQKETRKSSPRYGQPTMYRITLVSPEGIEDADAADATTDPPASYSTEELVHWTRVIHVADNCDDSEVYGVPRLRTVYNTIYDSQKIYGADAESYWKNALLKIILQTHPSLGGDVDVDLDSLKDMMEQFGNGMQGWLALMGMDAKAIAPAVVDPTPHVEAVIEKICIKIPVPKRVFCGSERGQLASGQDEAKWNKVVAGRHCRYLTPRLICPFIDRLIAVEVLPEPEDGYCVHWPDVAAQTESDKADVSLKRTQAINFYVTGECWKVIPPIVFLTLILGMTQEEANLNLAVLENYIAQKQEEDRQQQKADIEAGVVADPTKPSPDTVMRTDAMTARMKAKPPTGASPRKVKKSNGRPPV